MARNIEYHVTVAVPITIEDDGTYEIGTPYANDMGTPLNADTWEPETGNWFEICKSELDADALIPAADARLFGAANALRAIIARIDGVFDNPQLMAHGPLSTSQVKDVRAIAVAALGEDQDD